MTTAQIIFTGLAGMEDAQIKAGGGLVPRDKGEAEMQSGMSTSDYAKMRQASQKGTEINETIKTLKERQKPLRNLLEGRMRAIVADEMRNL